MRALCRFDDLGEVDVESAESMEPGEPPTWVRVQRDRDHSSIEFHPDGTISIAVSIPGGMQVRMHGPTATGQVEGRVNLPGNGVVQLQAASEGLTAATLRGRPLEAGDALRTAPCTTLVTGPGGAGQACGHGVECLPDHRCEPAESCPGTCAPLPAEGEPCPDFACAPGLSCVTEGMERRCRPPGDLGDPCGMCRAGLICLERVCVEPPGEGEPCDFPLDCAGDRACVGRTCLSPPAVGEVCMPEVGCAVGAACVEGVCREVAFPWEACGGGRVCPGTFHCGPCGVCEPLPTAGEPCDEAIGCALSACVEGTCRLLPNGAPCDQWAWPDACAGHCGAEGCEDTRPEGEGCFWTPECDPGLVCRLGVCRALCD